MVSLPPSIQNRAGSHVGSEHVRYSPKDILLAIGLNKILLAKYVRGMYAVRVKGRVPEDVEAELDSRGIKYRPRDQTDQD
jgi:hypothetical protein